MSILTVESERSALANDVTTLTGLLDTIHAELQHTELIVKPPHNPSTQRVRRPRFKLPQQHQQQVTDTDLVTTTTTTLRMPLTRSH